MSSVSFRKTVAWLADQRARQPILVGRDNWELVMAFSAQKYSVTAYSLPPFRKELKIFAWHERIC